MNAVDQLCRMITAGQGGLAVPITQGQVQNANAASCGGVSSFQQLFFQSLMQMPLSETQTPNLEGTFNAEEDGAEGDMAEGDGIQGLFQEMGDLQLFREMILSGSPETSFDPESGAYRTEVTREMAARDLTETGTVNSARMPETLTEAGTAGLTEAPAKVEPEFSVEVAETRNFGANGTPEKPRQAVEKAGGLEMASTERPEIVRGGQGNSAHVPEAPERVGTVTESARSPGKRETLLKPEAGVKPEAEIKLPETTERKGFSEARETQALTGVNLSGTENLKPLNMAAERVEPYSQIGREIQLKLEQKGPMEFKMQLEPKDLGQIDVRLKISEGKLIIDIAAASSKTQALLVSQADKLVMSMGLQNVEVETVQVNLQADQRSGEGLQGHLQQQQEHLEQQARNRQNAGQSPSQPYAGDAANHPESALESVIRRNNFVRMDYTV